MLYCCIGNSTCSYTGNVIAASGAVAEIYRNSCFSVSSGGTNIRILTISKAAKIKIHLYVTTNGQDYIKVNDTTVLTTGTSGGVYEYSTSLASGGTICVYQKRSSGSSTANSCLWIEEV